MYMSTYVRVCVKDKERERQEKRRVSSNAVVGRKLLPVC